MSKILSFEKLIVKKKPFTFGAEIEKTVILKELYFPPTKRSLPKTRHMNAFSFPCTKCYAYINVVTPFSFPENRYRLKVTATTA